MAGNFIELEQAAEMLGVTTDQLNDMRLSGEIHAMRDGSGWKFKHDELERVAEDRGISLAGAGDVEADDGDLAGGEISDLALEMEADEESSSPTVIGAPEGDDDASDQPEDASVASSEDSGMGISDIDLSLEDSELSLEPGSGEVSMESEAGSDMLSAGSDVLGGTDLSLEGSNVGSGDLEFDGSDMDMVSDLSLEDDDGLALSDDDDLTIGNDSDMALTEDDDDDLLLDAGSDITAGAGDTGINLTAPTDSGLNLEEEPLDLAGSSVSSLELPEDDDIIDLDDLDADPDEATQLKADDNFDLAPSVAELEADDGDSGSQVIALEDSEAFGAEAAVLAGEEPTLGEAEEVDELEGALDDEEIKPVTQPALPQGAMYGPAPEMPYSVWNVLGLLMIVMVLALTGMLMTDLIRNMWSWDSTYSATTPIIDGIVEMIGLDPS